MQRKLIVELAQGLDGHYIGDEAVQHDQPHVLARIKYEPEVMNSRAQYRLTVRSYGLAYRYTWMNDTHPHGYKREPREITGGSYPANPLWQDTVDDYLLVGSDIIRGKIDFFHDSFFRWVDSIATPNQLQPDYSRALKQSIEINNILDPILRQAYNAVEGKLPDRHDIDRHHVNKFTYVFKLDRPRLQELESLLQTAPSGVTLDPHHISDLIEQGTHCWAVMNGLHHGIVESIHRIAQNKEIGF